MTSDQERAAPAQQPVALTRLEQFIAAESADGTTDTIVSLRFLREIASALAVASLSEPELSAEIVRLQAEVERLTADRATVARIWESLGIKTYEEAGGREISEIVADLASRVEALSAEVGKITEALEATKTASHNHFMQAISNGEAAFDAKAKLAEAPDPRHFQILAEAMAEVKATSDGESDQPIADIVAGCLAEIEALPSRAALDKGATE